MEKKTEARRRDRDKERIRNDGIAAGIFAELARERIIYIIRHPKSLCFWKFSTTVERHCHNSGLRIRVTSPVLPVLSAYVHVPILNEFRRSRIEFDFFNTDFYSDMK